MRILVTGTKGQVAQAIAERAVEHGVDAHFLGRPDLDLADAPETITETLCAAARDCEAQAIINAAAYTAVDRAESEEALASAINGAGAGAVAKAAHRLGLPMIQLSTDYVFDGEKRGPWLESDPTTPLSAYGRSKLAGEEAVRRATSNHVILRTAWVYSPFGANFVKTMLRLAGEGRTELRVVSDQEGCPTSAFDIADATIAIAQKLAAEPDNAAQRGTFHLAALGHTNWAGFARAILAGSQRRKGPGASVIPIATTDYPTPARRPKNSVLDTRRLAETYEINLPGWQASLDVVLDRLMREPANKAS